MRRIATVSFEAPTPSFDRPRRLVRLTLVLCAALCAVLATGAGARAAVPTFSSSFTCSAAPDDCGGIESLTPSHLAVDEATGDVYAIDEADDAILRFNLAGEYQSTIPGSSTTAGSFGFESGYETQLAVDNSGTASQGTVYLASEHSGFAYGGVAGTFAFASATAANSNAFLWQSGSLSMSDICGAAVTRGGEPYAVDFTGGPWRLDPANGDRLDAGSLYGTGETCQVAFDSTGSSYVREYNSGNVDKFSANTALPGETPQTTLLGTIDETGGALDVAVNTSDNSVYTVHPGQINTYDALGSSTGSFAASELSGGEATGVAVDGGARKAYVADAGNGRIDVFDIPTPEYALGLTITGPGTVECKVESGPSEPCAAEYEEGRVIHLLAAPDAHKQVAWSGCDSENGNECTVTMSEPKAVIATFSAIEFSLTVNQTGTGMVECRVGAGSAGPCAASYEEGAALTLEATPGAHFSFAGWSGAGCSGTGTCSFSLNGDSAVNALFLAIKHKLTVNLSGQGSVACNGSSCASEYDEGSTIILTAIPVAGFSFDGFDGGGCLSSPCTLTLETDTTVTANFTASSSGGGDSGGSSGGGSPSPAPAPAPAPSPGPSPQPRPKPLKCKKGFKKRTVKGKARCVRVKKHRRAKHKNHRRGKHGHSKHKNHRR